MKYYSSHIFKLFHINKQQHADDTFYCVMVEVCKRHIPYLLATFITMLFRFLLSAMPLIFMKGLFLIQ